MSYDLLIRNGTIVDGTGAPPRQADVAVACEKIVAIGKITERADTIVDATGLIVSPGFIDPHTHYDAQICWDPLVTCSSWHGVTTVIMGNCGVGLAPCKPAERDIAIWNLVHVESIPFDALSKGVTWEWESFPHYLDAAARRGVGINVAFLAALSPFRHFVMGDAAQQRAASLEEIAQISSLLREALAAGAFGFSLTVMPQHIGYQTQPLACRLASDAELRAYACILRELGRGVIEIALTSQNVLSDRQYALLELLCSESGRPVTWLNLRDQNDEPEAWQDALRQVSPLLDRGCRPQVAVHPLIIDFNLCNPFLFASMASMKPVFGDTSIEKRKEVYAGPQFRRAFAEELKHRTVFHGLWERMQVKEATDPALKSMEWKCVAEIARERGVAPLDAFFDLAIEDELALEYVVPLLDINEERVIRKFCDPRTLIGISDGGAHVDMLCNAGYPTYLLGTFVREKKALSLEYAIKRITSEPAQFFGLVDRGELRPGFAADITVFDLNTVGSQECPEIRYDFPGGGRRLVTRAEGVKYTIVNGQVLYEGQRHTGSLPGKVLRAGSI